MRNFIEIIPKIKDQGQWSRDREEKERS